MENPATQAVTDLLRILDSSQKGLDEKEASERLARYGINEIVETKRIRWFQILMNQFKNVMVIILICGMAVSFLVGENLDGYAIMAIAS